MTPDRNRPRSQHRAASSPRALLVAYHFPPVAGSSGVQRALSFARDLPGFGWQPVVLSAHPRAYPATSTHQIGDIPEDVEVIRAFALDTARHLAVRGRHLRWMTAPDRWWSWWLGAVPAGLAAIRAHGVRVIWSTSPIPTAHAIGMTLARLSGLPWVADVRDLMTEPGWPEDPLVRRVSRWIETRAVTCSARLVVVSPGQKAAYLEQFPALDPARIEVIRNGFDEALFASVERETAPAPGERLEIVHSGIMYPDCRDPSALFAAMRSLAERGELDAERHRLVLRASGRDGTLRELAASCGIAPLVSFEPALPYREALAEMLHAGALLLLQGRECNTAIPAKLYEYIRARRPVLGLTEAEGATGREMRGAGYDLIAALESPEEIATALRTLLDQIETGTAFVPAREQTQRYSRRASSEQLARLFDVLTAR